MNIDVENIEKGIKFFNEGNFFEAHETWEDKWRALEKSPEKYFMQGLIMIAVALHHYKRKNYTGTLRLLEKGMKLLRESKVPEMKLDIENFLKEIALFQGEFKSSQQGISEKEFPKIRIQ
jgi:predicted metal-dependent hydrolase